VTDKLSCQLVIRYGHGDAAASMDCLSTHGVTEIIDTLVRGPLASCIARPYGKTRSELDQLMSCLRASGALVTEEPDHGPLSSRSSECSTQTLKRARLGSAGEHQRPSPDQRFTEVLARRCEVSNRP
jgi:hypothetical protein